MLTNLPLALALSLLVQAEPNLGHSSADWREAVWDGSKDKAAHRLDIFYKNTWKGPEGSYNLVIKVKRAGDRDGATFTWQETKQGTWTLFAFPIRVAGVNRPQILVRSQTSWGIDTSLYSIGEDGCNRQFSYSLRDPGAIRWRAKNGALTGFTVYDRWSPAGVKKETATRPGIRWEKAIGYTWSSTKNVWQEGAAKWRSWDVNKDKGLGKDPFTGERDCPFTFDHKMH